MKSCLQVSHNYLDISCLAELSGSLRNCANKFRACGNQIAHWEVRSVESRKIFPWKWPNKFLIWPGKFVVDAIEKFNPNLISFCSIDQTFVWSTKRSNRRRSSFGYERIHFWVDRTNFWSTRLQNFYLVNVKICSSTSKRGPRLNQAKVFFSARDFTRRHDAIFVSPIKRARVDRRSIEGISLTCCCSPRWGSKGPWRGGWRRALRSAGVRL